MHSAAPPVQLLFWPLSIVLQRALHHSRLPANSTRSRSPGSSCLKRYSVLAAARFGYQFLPGLKRCTACERTRSPADTVPSTLLLVVAHRWLCARLIAAPRTPTTLETYAHSRSVANAIQRNATLQFDIASGARMSRSSHAPR